MNSEGRRNTDKGKASSSGNRILDAALFTIRTSSSNFYWALRDWFDLKEAHQARAKVHLVFAERLEQIRKSGSADDHEDMEHDYFEELLQADAEVTRILRRRAHRLNIPVPLENRDTAWQANPYAGAGGAQGRSLTPAGEAELINLIRAEKRARRADRARVWTALIAIATVAYAVASYRQWQLTEKQFAAVDESTRKSNQYFEVGQRAYLGIKDLSILGFGSGSASFSALCENTGKTPARNITARCGLMVKRSALSPGENLLFDSDCTQHQQILPPGGFLSVIGKRQNISRDEEALIENQKAWLYFAGVVQYEDVFGKRHKTEFCAIYNPNKGVLPGTRTVGIMADLCANHNSVD